jgi:hypothetical protein
MLSGEMLNQMEELRQLEMTQVNSQNAYMAYGIQKDQADQANTSDLINKMQSTYPSYQNQNGLGHAHLQWRSKSCKCKSLTLTESICKRQKLVFHVESADALDGDSGADSVHPQNQQKHFKWRTMPWR